MIRSISHWSMPEGSTVEQSMRLAKQAGYDAIELAVDETGEFSVETSAEDLAAIKAMADEIGLQLPTVASGMGWAYPSIGPDPAICARSRELTIGSLDAAAALGAEVLLCVPGSVTDDYAYDQALADLVTTFKGLAREAEKRGVIIGVENVWNKFMLSPIEFRDLIDEIGSPFVQVYFDVGNVVLTGFPDQWIRILGERIKAVHFKDWKRDIGTIVGFIDLLEGDVPWDRVMAAFTEIGYNGAVTAEMMPPYQHFPERLLEATRRSMDAILTLG